MTLGPVSLSALVKRSQEFGPAKSSAAGWQLQPPMYAISNLAAYWLPYKGWPLYEHFHNGVDFSGSEGTPLLAMENAKVTRAEFDSVDGGGWVFEAEIRPGTRYGYAHLQGRPLVAVGAIVRKGQMVARIGSTGVATGNHVHVTLEVEEYLNGVKRTILWNPEMHMAGGPYANHARIRPVYGLPAPAPTIVSWNRLMRANGWGNIREVWGGPVVVINGQAQTTRPGQVFQAYRINKAGPAYTDPRNGKRRTDWVEVRYGGVKRSVAKCFLVTVS